MQSPQTIRVLGGVIVALGAIIVGIMAKVIWWMNDAVANSGKPGSLTKWNAPPDETRLMFAVVWMVLVFGVIAMITGVVHMITGKRNKKLVFVMIGMALILFVLSQVIANR